VGAARFLTGLLDTVPAESVTAIVNVADDIELHGLHISPDLDTVTYTLAGQIDPERGWGLAGETWQARTLVERYNGSTWFQLGDKDLGTHLFRTERLLAGATLSEVTSEIIAAWALGLHVVPVTDDRLRTFVRLTDGSEIGFQEYFVGRQHSVPVTAVRFDGAESSTPSPGVLDAITNCDALIIAPSNPVVSIGPVLAVPGVADAVRSVAGRTAAISPIVGGAALKGPAARLLAELGHGSGLAAVADVYGDLIGHLIADETDADEAESLAAQPNRPQVLAVDTIMATPERAAALARRTLVHLGLEPKHV